MKIMIFTQSITGGGAEKRASVYTNYMYKKGFDVTLVTMWPKDKEYYLEKGVKRSNVTDSQEKYIKLSKKERLKRLKKVIIDLKPDKIISFLPIFTAYVILATKFSRRTKNIEVIHSVALYQRKYKFFSRLIDIFCCVFSDKISLQCKEQLKCNKLFKKKCIISYNPIKDNWGNQSLQFDSLKAMCVGRLTKQKNFKLAILSAVEAHNANVDISLDIFGSGPQEKTLKKIINKNNANDYIHINGFSPNLINEYSKHNIFILSSKYEGFPNVLGEAMMAGLVCLSSKCPSGPKEMIANNHNGYLINNRQELSKKLCFLAENKALCNNIGQEARKTALELFSDTVVLPKLIQLLNIE